MSRLTRWSAERDTSDSDQLGRQVMSGRGACKAGKNWSPQIHIHMDLLAATAETSGVSDNKGFGEQDVFYSSGRGLIFGG
jgi:hypothetical protein